MCAVVCMCRLLSECVYACLLINAAYLKTKEDISSVSEARTQLSLLDTYETEKASMGSTDVAQLSALGADIKAQVRTALVCMAVCISVCVTSLCMLA